MKQIVIKKWIDGEFREVKRYSEEEVVSIRHHTDGLEIILKGNIRLYDTQCIIEFEQENEDKKIRKGIIKYLECSQFGEEHYQIDDDIVRTYIFWLEKQGEKSQGKSVLEVWKDMRFEVYQQASGNRHTPNYSDDSTKMFSLTNIDEIFEKVAEKQGEQNNKHLYDVIIALWDLLDKIDTFSDLQIDDTNPDNPFKKIEYIAQERHKFVKSDGYNLYIQGEQITDFKQGEKKPADKCIGCNNFKGCITCIDGNQYAHITEQKTTDKIEPKKELKKIEQTYFQKQEWTGYDEKAYEIALLDIDKSPSITKNDTIDWLKSIKNRVQPQPKQEWSEEDERIFTLCASSVRTRYTDGLLTNDEYTQASLWLKSLKERMKGE